jgi:hypothetical protein
LIRGVRIPTAGRRATIWIIPSSDRNAAPRYGSAHLLVPGIAGPEPAITEVDHAGVKHVRLVRTAISIERRIRPKMVAVSLGDRRWLAVSDDRLMPLVPNLLLGTLAVRSGSALRRRKRGTKRKRQSANQRSRGQSNCFHVQHIPAPPKPGYRTIAGTNNCQKTHSQSCAVTRSAEPVYTSETSVMDVGGRDDQLILAQERSSRRSASESGTKTRPEHSAQTLPKCLRAIFQAWRLWGSPARGKSCEHV